MKLIASLFSLMTIAALSSCSNSTETTTTETPVTTETAPAPAPAAEPTSKTTPTESKNSTEIGVSEDGVTYNRKNGDNETKVNVTEDSKSVIIKK